MTTTRRTVLAGITGLGWAAALPAWAQAIGSQSDPWAQVDPYADPRNGFPSQSRSDGAPPTRRNDGIFERSHGPAQDDDAEIRQATRAYGPYLAEDGGAVRDPWLQDAINAFIRPFVRFSDRPNLPWEARVANSNSINAWTVGGGKLSFNAGLVSMCDHPGELAAVVAHEMGHVDLGHITRGMRMQELLAHAAAGGFSASGAEAVGGLVAGAKPKGLTGYDVLRAGYSRTDEYEADEHAVEIMRRAGMNPSWAVSMMRKLARNGHVNGHHLVSDLLKDHPPATERAENLDRIIGGDRTTAADFVPPGWDVLKSSYPTPAQWHNA